MAADTTKICRNYMPKKRRPCCDIEICDVEPDNNDDADHDDDDEVMIMLGLNDNVSCM